MEIAIIGAGISGLTCARILHDKGLNVKVFEKSRGVGGRMTTRRTSDNLQFDHGAQYFTVRNAAFHSKVHTWQCEGLVALWNGRIVALQNGKILEEKHSTDRYVAVPGMNAICRHQAEGIEIYYETRVVPPTRKKCKWHLKDENNNSLGHFDIVVSSAPAKQTAELLREATLLSNRALAVNMSACWAIMVSFHESLQREYDAAFVHDSRLSWISLNDSKPNRTQSGENWVLHALPEWSQENSELPSDAIIEVLMNEFWKATSMKPMPYAHIAAHRWLYALPTNPLDEKFLYDDEAMIGACGDWCASSRVEGAYLSGMAIANHILNQV